MREWSTASSIGVASPFHGASLTGSRRRDRGHHRGSALPRSRRDEFHDVESRGEDAAMLAENELKQIQPDRLHVVEQETPVRMLGEVALRNDAVAQTMEAPVARTSRVGKAALLSQDRFHQPGLRRGLPPAQVYPP